ncbi:MAG: hypothetical protein ACRDWT_10170 [Jatrophihabitantaceae bacterium]
MSCRRPLLLFGAALLPSAALLLGAALCIGGPAAAAAPSGSVAAPLGAFAIPDSGRVGTLVSVQGSGWPSNAQLQLVTCGELAVTGSSACDMSAAYTLIGARDGRFSVQVRLGRPPVPCPCVLHVSDAGSGKLVNIPVTIAGLKLATPPKPRLAPSPPPLAIVSADLVGWRWTELVGASPTRTLVLTVRNSSGSPVSGARLQLSGSQSATSRGDLGTTTIATVPAHASRTYHVAVRLPAGIGGAYRVYGALDGGLAFSVGTHAFPWGLYGLALLVAGLLAEVLRRVLRARSCPPLAGHEPARAAVGAQPRS